jgi:hypothetical protein
VLSVEGLALSVEGELFSQSLGFEVLMVGVRIVGERINGNTSAGHEIAGDFEVFGIHEADEVLHDNIDAVLMKIAVIAEREEVELEALAFHHALTRDITNVDMPEIGLTGLRTECGKLRAVERNEILVLRMFVRESLQHLRIIIIAVLHVLISQECNPLQFIFCSHLFSVFIGKRVEKQ